MSRIIIVLFFTIINVQMVFAYTPSVGSLVRAEIMDAARKPIIKELAGQYVVFDVTKLKLAKGWAYLEAVPQLRNGEPIDYALTRFRGDVKAGLFDEWVGVLLKHDGGAWVVIAYVIGATDYPVVDWPKTFGAPAEIFK